MAQESKVVIDCNNRPSRVALRFDVLTLPFWGLFCPPYLVGSYLYNNFHDTWYGIPLVILYPILIFIGARGLFILLTNRLVINSGAPIPGWRGTLERWSTSTSKSASLTLPHPRPVTVPLGNLKAVRLESAKGTVKYLRLDLDVDQVQVPSFKRFSLSRMKTLLNPKARRRLKRAKRLEKQQLNLAAMLHSFFFGDTPSGKKQRVVERINLGRLQPEGSKKLLQALERWAPDCDIADEARNYLVGRHKDQHSSARQVKDALEIHYHAHEKIGNFLNLLGRFEWLFWSVLLSCCAITVIALAPYIAWYSGVFLAKLTGTLSGEIPSMDSSLEWWPRMFGELLGIAGRTLSGPQDLYRTIICSEPGTWCLIFLSMFGIWKGWRFAVQPNRLRLARDTFTAYCLAGGRTLYSITCPWETITRITLQKPAGTTAPEQWYMALHKANGQKPFQLALAGIKGQDRESLLRFIESNAPHIARDPELVEILMPAQKTSYTELWLQALSTPPKRERLAPLTNGQVLRGGRYIIDDQLGTGGQGIAYLARRPDGMDDKTTGSETIVIKEFILPVFVDKGARRQALERFEKEATLLQTLSHPQVVTLVDYFIEDHRGYLVLEHIKGKSLRRLIEDEGPITDKTRLISLAEQMREILAYLHSLTPPLVHRDFTPDNLIFNEDGLLKLIDFNVAHQTESRTTATVVGKHAYLPPEQFRGKPVPASDIYALGATMHFVTTGTDPEPVSCSRPLLLNEHVPAEIDELVARCTHLDAGKRANNVELAQTLSHLAMLEGLDEQLAEYDRSQLQSDNQAKETEGEAVSISLNNHSEDGIKIVFSKSEVHEEEHA